MHTNDMHMMIAKLNQFCVNISTNAGKSKVVTILIGFFVANKYIEKLLIKIEF